MSRTIIIQKEFDADDFSNNLWSGAVDTWKHIEEAGKENEAINYLNEVFCDRIPTLTEINDLLWCNAWEVYEAIGLTEDGETQREWVISLAELDELKHRDVLSKEQLTYIENSYYGTCELATVTEQDFREYSEELSQEQIDELNEVVS